MSAAIIVNLFLHAVLTGFASCIFKPFYNYLQLLYLPGKVTLLYLYNESFVSSNFIFFEVYIFLY